MSERRITRYPGQAICIQGPAIIRVNRRVTLTIEAPHDSAIIRLAAPKQPHEPRWPTRQTEKPARDR